MLEVEQPRGAVYIPPRVYNAYQMWRSYDRDVIARRLDAFLRSCLA